MKKFTVVFVIILLGVFQFVFAEDERALDTVDWEAFSQNLVNAFVVRNDGVKIGAMKNIITYSDYLDVRDAAFDVVRIYRYHSDQRVRQMAAVAITKMHNKWAMYFLKRNAKFEDNPVIKRQILDYIQRDKQQALTEKESEVTRLIAEIER
ncbi:MAG: hypothetical protein Kow0042_23830 [Calditrichia bacterium]